MAVSPCFRSKHPYDIPAVSNLRCDFTATNNYSLNAGKYANNFIIHNFVSTSSYRANMSL